MKAPQFRAARRSGVAVVVTALLASMLGAVAAPSAQAAGTPNIGLRKDAPATVLVGTPIDFSLEVSNPAGQPRAFNVTFRDVLPAGVSYVPGSTSPSSAGEPTIVTDRPASGQTTLIWSNLFDINPNGSASLAYQAQPDPDQYPVGATVTNAATAYASNDPFVIPKFDSNGNATAGGTGLDSDSATTTMSAIEVVKSEPSPEGELLRGVHDNSTVYTITVRNNGVAATEGITLVDYLPAGLEYLGCGATDNTSNGAVEYTGAPRLTDVPALASPPCRTPARVDTVDSGLPSGLAAGVYTRVEWLPFDLARGSERTFTYRAGIPLYENTTTWTGVEPTGPSGLQAANLDNNNGPSTAETAVEGVWANTAVAEGTYQGDDATGNTPVAVTAEGTETVTAEDLAIRKSVSPSAFSIGGTATYTLTLRTSEYRSAGDIVVTDVLPDGMSYTGSLTGASLSSSSGTGPTTLEFAVPGDALDPDATATITFTASMDGTYASGAPTATGDTFINTVGVTGRTSPEVVPEVPPGPEGADDTPEPSYDVEDTSEAILTTGFPTTDKKVGQDRRDGTCDGATYADTVPTPPFQIGDIICFQLTVGFATGGGSNNVLSPSVQDFLPSTIAYVPGSAVLGSANTLPVDQVDIDDSAAPATGGGVVTWTLGEVDPDATNPGGLVVKPLQPGNVPPVFQVTFRAQVVSTVLDTNTDIAGNLLKTGAVNTAGDALTGRDQSDFEVAGSQVAVLKGVAQVNGLPDPGNGPNVDDVEVKGGDIVTFRVDITNTGTQGAGSDVPVRRITVVDTLAPGITCSEVSAISNGGTCAGGLITWDPVDPADSELEPGDVLTLTYDVTVPGRVSVDTEYVNTVQVTRYESLANTGWVVNEPVDITDESSIQTPNVSLSKTGVTSLNLTNNNRLTQFTVGERITYTVDGRIPASTTATRGTIVDTLPPGLRYVSSSAQYAASGDPADLGPLPTGTTLAASGQTVRLTLPTPFANTSTADDALFRLTITAEVLGGTYTHGQQLTNVARFSGSGFSTVNAQYSARVVLPNPVIAKSNNASGPVLPSSPVTYTLVVTNPSASRPTSANPLRPTSYDTVVVDCLPPGITFGSYGALPAGVTSDSAVPGDGANGCAAGTTRLGWTLGAVPTSGAGSSVTLTYTAAVAPGTSAGADFTNTATVTGSTLDNSRRDPQVEGVLSSSDTSTVGTSNGTIDKSVVPLQAAVGDTATWTIKATYDRDLTFRDAVVTDLIPAGVDLDSIVPQAVACSEAGAPICGTTPTLAVDPATRTVTWTVGDVGVTAGDLVVTLVYEARIQNRQGLAAGDVLTNTATSRWATTDGGPLVAGGSASADLVIVRPQLSVTKSVSDETPTPGAAYEYTVLMTNDLGSQVSQAYLIEVQDVVPSGVIVDESTISDGGTIAGATDSGGGTITWLLSGPLAPGESVALTYEAALPSDATSGTFTNVVDVPSYASASSRGDIYDDVDPAEATVTVGAPIADLSIVKTPSGATTPGSTWTFSMAVRNLGPSDAEGPVVVTDELPAGLTYVSNGPDWTCFPFDQTVFCILTGEDESYPGLAADTSAPALLLTTSIADQPTTASYTNVSEVFGHTEDPNPDNDTSRATVTVAPVPIPPPNPDPDPDPEKPVDPVDPGKPVDPTDPDPQEPGRPPVVPQEPTRPITPPTSIQPDRPTVVFPGTVTTNAGQKVRVDVQCRALRTEMSKATLTFSGRVVPMGDLRYCDVTRTSRGKVIVTATYPGPVLVKVTYSAKQVPGFSAFTKVKRYVVVPR